MGTFSGFTLSTGNPDNMFQDLSAAWYVGKIRFASKFHSWSYLKCNVEAPFFTVSSVDR